MNVFEQKFKMFASKAKYVFVQMKRQVYLALDRPAQSMTQRMAQDCLLPNNPGFECVSVSETVGLENPSIHCDRRPQTRFYRKSCV
jgi:hypothetical protein